MFVFDLIFFNNFLRVLFFKKISECNNNMYGEHCSKLCGKCRVLKQCNHINGTCFHGCEVGYEGQTCTDSKGRFEQRKHE